jgi:hypothetical protein
MPESRAQWIYAALALLGTILPLSQLVPWLLAHGPDARLLYYEALATRIGAFLAMEVLVAGAAVIALIVLEGGRLALRDLWLPVAATLVVGPSLGLPLFLYMRERHRISA